jgi:hypothetical protein
MSATCRRCLAYFQITPLPWCVTRARNGHDALGHTAAATCGRLPRHEYPQHHVAALARLAEAGKAAVRLALALQHKRFADFRTAALCAEGTWSVVNMLAIVAGRRGRRVT